MGKVQETLLEQLHSSCITAPFPNVFNSVAQSEELTSIKTTLPYSEEGRGYSQGTGSHHCCRLGVAVAARTATKELHNSNSCFLSLIWAFFNGLEAGGTLLCPHSPHWLARQALSPSAFSSTSWLEMPTPARAVLRQPWYFSSLIKEFLQHWRNGFLRYLLFCQHLVNIGLKPLWCPGEGEPQMPGAGTGAADQTPNQVGQPPPSHGISEPGPDKSYLLPPSALGTEASGMLEGLSGWRDAQPKILPGLFPNALWAHS